MKVTGNQYIQMFLGVCEDSMRLGGASIRVPQLYAISMRAVYGNAWKTFCVLGLVLVVSAVLADTKSVQNPSHELHYQQILDDMTLLPSANNIASSALQGDDLQVHVVQSGENNVSVLTQQGSQLTAEVKQVGDSNTSYAFQEGEQSELTVKQYHHDNTSHIIQSGDAHSIYLKQLGHSEMTIEQWGDDKRLFIVQPPYSDITIRQLH